MVHWFKPKPHQLLRAEVDLTSGGRFTTVMEIDGNEMVSDGCILEVITGEKLVFTDTMSAGYRPNANPFFTAIITFADHPDGTEYTVIARHKDDETAQKHENMGFSGGWGTVASQLESYAQSVQH